VRGLWLLCVAVLVAAVLPEGRAVGQPADPVTRLAGTDAIGTAIAVSRAHWDQSDEVVLASDAAFADALVSGTLAAQRDAPVLLTDLTALADETFDELRRLGAQRVVVVGGPQAVSEHVTQDLQRAGLHVERLGGSDRYATAALVAQSLGQAQEVALASGERFADILAAGSLAAVSADPVPVLLTLRDEVPAVTTQALAGLGARRVLILGGQDAVSADVEADVRALGLEVRRLGGAHRYETAALASGEALRRTTATTLPLVVTSGASFTDALSAPALAGRLNGLLLVVPNEGLAHAAKVNRLLTLAGPRLDEAWLVGGKVGAPEQISAAISTGPITGHAVAPGAPGDGAVATIEPLATQAALDVLADGGNAIDAAVAAAGVLGVAEPFSAGIGGGGFMLVYSAADGTVTTFDSRETAPAAFYPEVFLDPATGEPLPFDELVTSGLGVGVPGTVAGWALALERFGTRPLAQLLEPSIEAADYGFPLDPTFVSQVEDNADRFAAFTSTTDLYLPIEGKPQAPGAWFRNPDLATTMRLIARDGQLAIGRGPVANAIVDTVQRPPVTSESDRVIRPGLMTADDLARYVAIERPPVVSDYRGSTLYGMGPPSSGGLTVALALNQLERFDFGAMPRGEALHTYLESTKLAWADRNRYIADPAFVDVPVDRLLSQAYADRRSALITSHASATPRGPGEPLGGSTTHLVVADPEGNIVSYTFTIEQIGGSGIVVPGYGFLLNNELTDFDPEPTHPNAPAAGKRPRSSMSPTIVLRDGKPIVALGTPGGATIITTVLQTLIGFLALGNDLPGAIAAPRAANFNSDLGIAEPAFLATPAADLLEARGHKFEETEEIGAVTGIAFDPGGTPMAATEPTRRGGGAAAVTSTR
jgi:gamma-glutamyltranspeptidase/glutathione hydrolase